MIRGTALLAAFGIVLASRATASDDDPVKIEARRYNESTGELSKNLLEKSDTYSGWNDGLSAAPSRRSRWGSGDILVVTKADTATSDDSRLEDELQILITNKGNVLAKRTSRLAADRGVVRLPIWLTDVTCAGAIKINATYRGKRTMASLNMFCGE